jgi:acyl carrier protein|tara:strand:- start:5 stop:394 length:390 start_codon:yes stop_codon:yes gene_type:complete
MSMTQEDITGKVQEALIEALGVDDDEATPEATLIDDLGAESIDFLDIIFRLEKAFDIKIVREELFPGDDVISNADFIVDGKVTQAGIDEMKKRLPHLDLSDFESDPDVNKIPDLFTVKMIINFIDSKIN